LFLAVVLLLTSVFFFGVTPSSAQGGTPSNPILTPNVCTLNVSFVAPSTGGPFTYVLNLWDDGVIVDSDTVTVADGASVSLNVTVTAAIGTSAPGVGVVLIQNGSTVYVNDPYLGLDGPCAAAAANPGCLVAEGKYQGLVTVDARLYWAPEDNKPVEPATFIKAGMVVTINDSATPGWYKITWACRLYYIKIDGVVGNPAKVTKPHLPGTPLNTDASSPIK
jgi:hypothetical protein